jgi:hypothetical protein
MAKKGIGSQIASSASNVYKGLTPRARGIIVVSGVILGGLIIYKIFKNISNVRDRVAARDEAQSVSDELQQQNQNAATKQTLSQSEVDAIANSMYFAMDGYGTYEDTIYSQFKKLKNNADFLAVQKSYGIRTVHSKVYFVNDVTSTLIPALQSELSQGWVDYINELLQTKGITYRI